MTSQRTVQRQSQDEANARLIGWASCTTASGADEGRIARVIADYLRHGLGHLGAEEGQKASAVHVHQLLGTLRRQLSGWMPEPDQPPWVLPEEVRQAQNEDADVAQHVGIKDLGLHILKKLELLGECGHRGGGYYLPTPPRLVPLQSGAALLVGGLCTSELSSAFGLRIGWAGLGRALPADKAADAFSSLPRQGLSAWTGLPDEPLDVWTRNLLDLASTKAFPTAGFDPAAFEVYAPHLQPRQGQAQRWVSPRSWRRATGAANIGVSLCRTRTRPYRFWLATLSEDTHGARYRAEWAVRPEWSRRLLYGIDLLTGHRVSAAVLRVSGGQPGEREVRLSSWPAWEEYQVLTALAYDSTPPGGPYLPVRLRVAGVWLPDVRSVLSGLSIQIREDV
jgi:hypothetical protein